MNRPPPIITDKTIVIAGSVTDNFSTRETSGVIRGFDVNTGKLLWAFDPGAKDPNAIPSDEHTFTFNSPNSWAPAAYDAKLDLVYLPMGVTTPDIWGGNRTPEQERYASAIVALNATTGKLAGAIRPFTTICGIWTCHPSRRLPTLPLTAKPFR
jgi:quinoprotein glucose dehydrogenase